MSKVFIFYLPSSSDANVMTFQKKKGSGDFAGLKAIKFMRGNVFGVLLILLWWLCIHDHGIGYFIWSGVHQILLSVQILNSFFRFISKTCRCYLWLHFTVTCYIISVWIYQVGRLIPLALVVFLTMNWMWLVKGVFIGMGYDRIWFRPLIAHHIENLWVICVSG